MVNVRKAIDSNPGGTATLLEAVIARRDRIRRVVVASSMVVYGEGAYRCPDHGIVMPGVRPTSQLRERRWEPRCPECGLETEPVPLTEDKPLRPISVYGISKRDTEELALVLGEAYGFEAVALRYLNVYGPRQALANPYTGVAAIFSSRLLGGNRPRVFEDGRQIRDLVHVSDIVAATIAAMDAAEAPGNAFNVATGRRIEIGELASRLSDLLAPDLSRRSPASSAPATSATASPTRPAPATCSASRPRPGSRTASPNWSNGSLARRSRSPATRRSRSCEGPAWSVNRCGPEAIETAETADYPPREQPRHGTNPSIEIRKW